MKKIYTISSGEIEIIKICNVKDPRNLILRRFLWNTGNMSHNGWVKEEYQSGFTSVLQWMDNAYATYVKASSSIVLKIMFIETGFFFTWKGAAG